MHRLPQRRDNWDFVSNSRISLVMRTVRINKLSYYSCCSQTVELMRAGRLEENNVVTFYTTNPCPSINPLIVIGWRKWDERESSCFISSCKLKRLWSPSEARHLLIGHRFWRHFDSTCLEDLTVSVFTRISDQYMLHWFNLTADNMIC